MKGFKCDQCEKTFYRCEPTVELRNWHGSHGGILLPNQTYDFCSAPCFEAWVRKGMGVKDKELK